MTTRALGMVTGWVLVASLLSCAREPTTVPLSAPSQLALAAPSHVVATDAAPSPMAPSASAPPAGPPEAPPPRSYPFHEPLPDISLSPSEPAMRVANLSPGECRKEVEARALPVVRSKQPAKGVATPMRIAGPLHGVQFVAPAGKFGVLDCRLALALDELASVLVAHHVVEVRIDNTYRPSAHLPGRKGKRSQHAYGLAADITSLRFEDGRTISVEGNWGAPRGATPCGPDAPLTTNADDAITLRNLVCDVARHGVFHHMLTPSYDAAHSNHFHFDVKRDADRRSVR